MFNLKFLGLILACSALGCSQWEINESRNYNVVIDASFPTDRKELVHQAVDNWQSGTGNYVHLNYSDKWIADAEDQILISPNSILGLTAINDDGTLAGLTTHNGTSSTIQVAIDIPTDQNFLMVAQHELGHALGLEHSGPYTVMYWTTEGGLESPVITCADLYQFCNIWDCQPELMPLCL